MRRLQIIGSFLMLKIKALVKKRKETASVVKGYIYIGSTPCFDFY